jgi:geranylgeranyl pyrophosphate synthase
MYSYGLNLGIAFQIIDDILDYTEDQSTIGKPAGNDLRQGMVTLPLIYALQAQSENGHHQQVQKLLTSTEHEEHEIREIIDWVLTGDNVERARKDAYAYADKAREDLYHFAESPARAVMDELIDFVVRRKR